MRIGGCAPHKLGAGLIGLCYLSLAFHDRTEEAILAEIMWVLLDLIFIIWKIFYLLLARLQYSKAQTAALSRCLESSSPCQVLGFSPGVRDATVHVFLSENDVFSASCAWKQHLLKNCLYI